MRVVSAASQQQWRILFQWIFEEICSSRIIVWLIDELQEQIPQPLPQPLHTLERAASIQQISFSIRQVCNVLCEHRVEF